MFSVVVDSLGLFDPDFIATVVDGQWGIIGGMEKAAISLDWSTNLLKESLQSQVAAVEVIVADLVSSKLLNVDLKTWEFLQVDTLAKRGWDAVLMSRSQVDAHLLLLRSASLGQMVSKDRGSHIDWAVLRVGSSKVPEQFGEHLVGWVNFELSGGHGFEGVVGELSLPSVQGIGRWDNVVDEGASEGSRLVLSDLVILF